MSQPDNYYRDDKIMDKTDTFIFTEEPSQQTTTTQTIIVTTRWSKYDQASEQYQEFSEGYHIKITEVFIILGIILFWLMAIRKFTKNFDKIRTTHYREIPYKYKLKDVENLDAVNVTSNQKDGVIFTRDPINNMIRNSKLPHEIISNLPTTGSSMASLKCNNEILGGSRRYIQRHKFSVSSKARNNFDSFESRESTGNYRKLSHSLVNISKQCGNNHLRRDDSVLNDNIYRIDRDKVPRIAKHIRVQPTQYDQFKLTPFKQSVKVKRQLSTTVENHPLNISPLIRRSFLDLHKQAVSNSTRNNSRQSSKRSTSP